MSLTDGVKEQMTRLREKNDRKTMIEDTVCLLSEKKYSNFSSLPVVPQSKQLLQMGAKEKKEFVEAVKLLRSEEMERLEERLKQVNKVCFTFNLCSHKSVIQMEEEFSKAVQEEQRKQKE